MTCRGGCLRRPPPPGRNADGTGAGHVRASRGRLSGNLAARHVQHRAGAYQDCQGAPGVNKRRAASAPQPPAAKVSSCGGTFGAPATGLCAIRAGGRCAAKKTYYAQKAGVSECTSEYSAVLQGDACYHIKCKIRL